MKKRIGEVFLIVIIFILLLSGCHKNSKSNSNDVKIYYSASEDGDYYEDLANQLKEEASKHGAKFDVGYAQNSIETQSNQIKNAFKEGYNVFLCGLVSSSIITEIKSSAGNRPIVFISTAPDDEQLEKDKYISVLSNEFIAGQYQAEFILEKFASKNEINVVILKGPQGRSGTIGRTNGLKQTLKASGKEINYVFEDYADWSSEKAKELLGLFLKTGIPIDCVVGNNDDMALGAIEACEEANIDMSEILFLGVDASVNGCQAIIDGRMDFTVYQPVSNQMIAAIEAAEKLSLGESIKEIDGATDDGKHILIPFEKVDASNVSQYSK